MVLAAPRTDPQLDALVASIVERVQPELILLFGSRVRGKAREDSDYDLMLVLRDGANVEGDRGAANDARRLMHISADILACTASEYGRWQHDPGFLHWLVSREGRLLYTRGIVPQRSPRTDRVSEQPTEGRAIWIERAADDFQAATASVASATPPWAAICFHAHACIEKLLKALIVSAGSYPPHTHNLLEVMSHLPASIRDDQEMVAIATRLNDVYPKSRYWPHPMPTPDEARAAFDAARRGRELLLKHLKRRE
jgi:HEPN domain-containing protein/predicted nucleotidyltransferase